MASRRSEVATATSVTVSSCELGGVPTSAMASSVRGLYDKDGSRYVGIVEFLGVLAEWGTDCTVDPCTSDGNDDGTIGIDDFLMVLSDWGPCP